MTEVSRGFARTILLAILGAASLTGCATSPWHSPTLRDHPLVGRIWDVRAAAFIDEAVLLGRLEDASVVLLGESHDNVDHHRLQLKILESRVAAGLRPALVMEQFDTEHQPLIDAALESPGISADAVADAGKLSRQGWGWHQYEPLVGAALKAKLPIVAANLSRTEARRVASEGFAALGDRRAAELAVERAGNDAREKTMSDLIVQGHCGEVPRDLLPKLVRSQRARDAVMAGVLAGQRGRGAVGILGRGHVRRDLGVPIYLAQTTPDASVVAVGIVEVAAGRDDPRLYLGRTEVGEFDYLWFTPGASRTDPCAGFSLKRSAAGRSAK